MGQQIANTLGMGLGALSTIQAIRSGQYQNQAIQRAQALSNPEVRAGLVNSPFTAGTMFLGGQQHMLPAPPSTDPNQVNVPQQSAWQPNLSPMDPTSQLKQAQSQEFLNLQQTDPNVFALTQGAGTPKQFGDVYAAAPDVLKRGNMVAGPSGLGMYAQPAYTLGQQDNMNVLQGPTGEVLRTAGASPGAAAEQARQRKIAEQKAAGYGGLGAGGGVGRMSGGGAAAPPLSQPGQQVGVIKGAGPIQTIPLNMNQTVGQLAQQYAPLTGSASGAFVDENQQAAQAAPPQQIVPLAPPGQDPMRPQQAGPPGAQPRMPLMGPQPTGFIPLGSPQQGIPPPAVAPPVAGPNPPPAGLVTPPPPTGTGLGATRSVQDTGEGVTNYYSAQAPTITPTQRAGSVRGYGLDETKYTPAQNAQIQMDMQRVGDREKKVAAAVQGLPDAAAARLGSLAALSNAFLELHDMGKPVLDYVGPDISPGGISPSWSKMSLGLHGPSGSLGGLSRMAANVDQEGDPVLSYAQSLIDEMHVLPFSYGGKTLSTNESSRVDAFVPDFTQKKNDFLANGVALVREVNDQILSILGTESFKMQPWQVDYFNNLLTRLNAAVQPLPKKGAK